MAEQSRSVGDTFKRIADALKQNLVEHRASKDAFVVSIYGEWGIGKTRCLKDLKQLFETELTQKLETFIDAKELRLVIPVFFEAWRYEHEQHLVVPLLKTIERSVGQTLEKLQTEFANQRGPATRIADAGASVAGLLKQAGNTLGDLSVALLSGIKFKFAPLKEIFGMEFDVSPKDMFDRAGKAKAADEEEEPSGPRSWRQFELNQRHAEFAKEVAKFESLYFDSDAALRALTRPDAEKVEASGPALSFAVLIDDLDRCLPEKAIQVLESVKLFLNVPGFCFVLAVDDEVVERGIAHRYQDYLKAKVPQGNGNENSPISGAEYLEKIVHLPVHLPRWTEDEARIFLREHYPQLFAPPVQEAASGDMASPAKPADAAKSPQRGSEEAEKLLDLIVFGIPLVPRKLIRLVEALDFERQHFNTLSANSHWSARHMARRIALQQLYPALYRHVRLKSERYWRLFQIDRDTFDTPTYEGGHSLDQLNQMCDPNRKEAGSAESNPTADGGLGEQRNLLQKIHDCAQARGSPDPLRLFHDRDDKGGRWLPAFDRERRLKFEEFGRLYFHGLALPAEAPQSAVARHWRYEERRPLAQINDADSFLGLLLSSDRISRQKMIEDRRLAGTQLADDIFAVLLDRLADASYQSRLVDLDWLEDAALLLSPEQLLMLYQRHSVLDRMLALSAKSGGTTA